MTMAHGHSTCTLNSFHHGYLLVSKLLQACRLPYQEIADFLRNRIYISCYRKMRTALLYRCRFSWTTENSVVIPRYRSWLTTGQAIPAKSKMQRTVKDCSVDAVIDEATLHCMQKR